MATINELSPDENYAGRAEAGKKKTGGAYHYGYYDDETDDEYDSSIEISDCSIDEFAEDDVDGYKAAAAMIPRPIPKNCTPSENCQENKNDNANNAVVAIVANEGGMAAMLTDALARRKSRIRNKQKTQKNTRQDDDHDSSDVSSDDAAEKQRKNRQDHGDGYSTTTTSKENDVSASEQQRKKNSDDSSSSTTTTSSKEEEGVSSSDTAANEGGMAAMLADAVARRKSRIRQKQQQTQTQTQTTRKKTSWQDDDENDDSSATTSEEDENVSASDAEQQQQQQKSRQDHDNGFSTTTSEDEDVSASDAASEKNGKSSSIVAGGGGMEAMLAAAIARREERKRRSEASAASSNDNENDSILVRNTSSTGANSAAADTATTATATATAGIMGMTEMIAAAAARRQDRVAQAGTNENEQFNSNSDAAAAAIEVNADKSQTSTSSDDAVQLSLAEMAVQAAARRQLRVEEKRQQKEEKARQEQQKRQEQLDGGSDAENNASTANVDVEQQSPLPPEVEVHKESHRKTFVDVAEQAATYGRLVRLQEKVVEAQGSKEYRHPLAGDTWSGPKLLLDEGRSDAMRAIQEAAALGRIKRLSGEHNNNDGNGDDGDGDDDDDDDTDTTHFDIENQLDENGRKILRTNFLLDRHVQETSNEKKDRMWSDSDAIGDRDHKTAQYKSFDDVHLPTDVLPTYARVVGKRGTKKSFSSGADLAVIAMQMMEKRNNNSNDGDENNGGGNENNDDAPVVMHPGRLRVLESISSAVAASAWERKYRLQRPKAELKVTRRCMCPYCKDPNPYQTHKYKRMMYPDRFDDDYEYNPNDNQYSNNNPGAAGVVSIDNSPSVTAKKSDDNTGIGSGGVRKKKTIRIVRRRKKNSSDPNNNQGTNSTSTTTTKRVIDGTSLTSEELMHLTAQLQQQGGTDMTTEELIRIAQQLSTSGGAGAQSQEQQDTSGVLSTEELLKAADGINGSNAYAPTCSIVEERATQGQGEVLVSSSRQEGIIDTEPTTDELLQLASDLTTRQPPQSAAATSSNEHNQPLTNDNRSSEHIPGTTTISENQKSRGRSNRGRMKNPLRKRSPRPGHLSLSGSENDRSIDGNAKEKEKKVRRRRLRVRNPLRRISSCSLALSDSEIQESQKPASLRNKNKPRSLSPRTHEAASMSASVSPKHVSRKEIKRMQKPVRLSWRNNKKHSKGSQQENNSERKERDHYCPPPSPPNSSHTRRVKSLPIRKVQRGAPREDATTTAPLLKPSRSLQPGSSRRPQQQTRKPPARTQSLEVQQKPSSSNKRVVGSCRPGEAKAKKSMTSLDRGTYHTPPSRERRTRIQHRTIKEEHHTVNNNTTPGGTTFSEDLPPRPLRINSVPTKAWQQQPQQRAAPTTSGAEHCPKSSSRRIMFDSEVLENKEACKQHSLEGATAPTQSLSDNDEFYSLGPSEHSRAESNRSFASSFDLSEQEPQRPEAVFRGSPTSAVNRIHKKEKKKTTNTDKKKSQGKSRFW